MISSIIFLIKKNIKVIIDLIFPKKCIICDKHDCQNEICTECWVKIKFISQPSCFICSTPFLYEEEKEAICAPCIVNKPNYDRAIAILEYDDASKKIIHKFKYNDQLHILNYIVNLMTNIGKEIFNNIDMIAPVPIHKYKLLKRGYNQSALIAMNIASRKNLPYLPQLLIKSKNTIAQTGLKKSQRISNISNSFKLNHKFYANLAGKNILLIDDVITTGSTINECSRVLKKEGANKIFVLTLAKKIS